MQPQDSQLRIRTTLAVFCLLITVASYSRASPPGFQWSGQDDLIELKENGRPVFSFQLEPKSLDGKFTRANYVHPLYDPDGEIVTEDFPPDHRHHRGVFWAWHQVRLNGTQLCDSWNCKDIQWLPPTESDSWLTKQAGTKSAKLTVVRDWVAPDPQAKNESLRVLRETVTITAWPLRESTRILDFDLRFQALIEGVTIGGSENTKGYGGFSPRIRLAEDVIFQGRKGILKPQPQAAIKGGPWVDIVRTLDGKKKGVAIMVHPSHPNFPLKWILRPNRSMQNAQWPGRKPVPVSTQTLTQLRYRLVLHNRELNRDELNALWKDFR